MAAISRLSLALVTLVLLPGTAFSQEAAVAADVVQADAAGAHVGQEVCVEMVVLAARALPDKDMCFLNSRRDHRDAETFTVVIFKRGLERLREAGIENPAMHFLDRTIRVRGTVETHRDKPQIVVEDPAQIELVDTEAGPSAAAAPEAVDAG